MCVCPALDKENPMGRDASVHAWLQDKLQQGGATPLLYENVNMSRLGNSDNMPGMPGQVCGLFCCCVLRPPFSFTRNTQTHTHAYGKVGEICEADSGMKRSGSGV